MNVLFVDQEYHIQTKSSAFFQDILKSAFSVRVHYYKDLYHPNISNADLGWADLVIIWEFPLDRNHFAIPGKPCVFVPMYDADWGSICFWKRVAKSGLAVISFSEPIRLLAHRSGVRNLLDVRYSLDPVRYSGWAGNPKIAALWDRGYFGLNTIKKLFRPGQMEKIILFRRPQYDTKYTPVPESDAEIYHIQVLESEYLPDEEYLKLLRDPGVYIAPRPKEGIGMSFLEQLAMGKCVIVHDDATMNEYVRDGVNGIVRNLWDPDPVSDWEIERVRRQVEVSSAEQFLRWQDTTGKIVPFIQNVARQHPVRFGSFSDRLLLFGYCVEAFLDRISK